MIEFRVLEPIDVPEIVYGLAEKASEIDQPEYEENIFDREHIEFLLNHEEEIHLNRGLAEKYNPNIDPELQVKRPGGGGSLPHEGTLCYGLAVPKRGPKEDVSRGLEQLGEKLEDDLQDLGYNAQYIQGDIYSDDGSQLIGLGAYDAGNAAVFRGCFYPERPENSRELIEADGRNWEEYIQNITPIEGLEDVLKPENYETTTKEEYGIDQREKAEALQLVEGFRQPYHCFTEKQTELKK